MIARPNIPSESAEAQRPKASRGIPIASVQAFLLGFVTLAVLSAAQSEFNPKPPEVHLTPVGKVQVARGGAVVVPLIFRLTEGYHINSNVPRSDLLIPTVLTLQGPSQVSVRITYPKGEDVAFEFDPGNKLSVYSGEFTIHARIRPSRATKPGEHTVRGSLKYQACNDRSCFPPKTMPLEFQLSVEKDANFRVR